MITGSRAPLETSLLVSGMLAGIFGAWLFLPKPPLLDGIAFSQCVRDRDGHLLDVTLTPDQKFRIWTPLERDLTAPHPGDLALRRQVLSTTSRALIQSPWRARFIRSPAHADAPADRPSPCRSRGFVTICTRARFAGKADPNPPRPRTRAALFEIRNPRGLPEPCALRPQHRRRRRRRRNLFRQRTFEPDRTRSGRPERHSAKPDANARCGPIGLTKASCLAQNRWYDRTQPDVPAEFSARSFEARAVAERQTIRAAFRPGGSWNRPQGPWPAPRAKQNSGSTTLDLDKHDAIERRVADYIEHNPQHRL